MELRGADPMDKAGSASAFYPVMTAGRNERQTE